MENNSSKQVLLSVLGVAVLVVAVVGVSFAAFSYSKLGDKVNTITTGTVTMNYQEGSNALIINNALPITDAEGKAQTDSFTFTVNAKASGNVTLNYDIAAVKQTGSTMRDQDVRLYLTDGTDKQIMAPSAYTTGTSTNGAPAGSMILHTDSFTSTAGALDETRTYKLRMWVAESTPSSELATSKTFKVKIGVYATQAI